MSAKENKMNLKSKDNFSSDDTCVVCFRKSKIYSIGECDHPVCHECSTRMRVLCGRTECPICRKDMAMVIFTYKIQPFVNIQYRSMNCERRYSIYFENDSVMKAYDTLIQHRCSICQSQEFPNFNLLKEHMRKVHEKFYCDLCVDNLKIFTHERRCYSREFLAQHRRIGDTDDKSHKGHPLCEFCDSRFMDNDELFRHLRRNHFFCHFCDADGIYQYYDDYDALREHFQKDHYLCEEGNCREERFTSAFRTKLDLQAHTAQYHGHSMSKSEARQARTVDIAFTVNHRQGHFSERGRGGRRGEGRGRRQPQDFEEQVAAAAATPPSELGKRQQAVDINCVQDFPSLKGGKVGPVGDSEGGNTSSSVAHKLAQQNRFTIRTTRGHHLSEEEFPSLGSTTSVTVSSNVPSHSNSSSVSVPSASLHLSVNTKKNNLQDSQANSGSNVSIQYNCTSSSFTTPQSDMTNSFAGRGRGKPRIGNISHSGNITVKSTPTGARPKSSLMEEDFPLLQPSSKPFSGVGQISGASWVPNHVNSSTVVAGKGPKKTASSTEGNTKSVNSTNNTTNNNNNSNVKNKNSPNIFGTEDFPTLAPSAQSQQKLNYCGRSSLTIPMKKALPTTKDKPPESDENLGKGKKKKKATTLNKSNSFENNKNMQPTVSTQKNIKKKSIILNNALENEDPEGPAEDFTRKRQGEYESVAPVMSSNVKLITAGDHSTTKRSELQIGPLKAPDLSSEDFPSLGSIGISAKSSKKSSKVSQQPLENLSNQSSWNQTSLPSKKRPSVPPGFSKKSQPEIPPGFADTNMTFTSSLGQKFAISPTSDLPPKGASLPPKPSSAKEKKKSSKPPSFILPPNFEQRNKALIDAIREGCAGSAEKFNKFKQLAEIFRSGQIKGQQYYERCKQIMGKSVFLSILPELLALLPDIEKQQAVYEAYRKVDGGQGCQACFAVCAVCQQVLLSDDFPMHMTKHEFPADEYPSLGKSVTSPHNRK